MVVKFEKKESAIQNDLDDGSEDEIESFDDLIKSFLQRSKEDGGFTTITLRELAYLVGINNYKLINSDVDLVRAIQKAVKHRPCFRTENHNLCEDSDCLWKAECKKIIAEWLR
jgi:hypothetical protein